MLSDTARMIGTVGIWFAVAVILTFGVFRIDWSGEGAMFIMVTVVAIVCGAAALSTVAVWRGRGSAANDTASRN
jgi:hypothetical protein